MRKRAAIEVTGLVQGVGFRPFVYSLATALDLSGFVQNRGGHIVVDVEGEAGALSAFVDRLERERPPHAWIESVRRQPLPALHRERFVIADSQPQPDATASVPLDAATCDACLAELFALAARRWRHPFIACSACGPRYSMLARLPFDRTGTSMARFAMCAACAREYADPHDRRFHAQAICCHDCGPRLIAREDGRSIAEGAAALRYAVDSIARGAIVAIKGIGGFHLACDAASDRAVAELRRRKRRESKPFAVMLPHAAGIDLAAGLDCASAAALLSIERPIVLLDSRVVRRQVAISDRVADACPSIGLFLPYSPVHHLLTADIGRPLVMTSGNRSDEPMACDDEEAATALKGIADVFLTHDRAILRRCDDSVTRIARGRTIPIRRGRGAAPRPLTLAEESARVVLATGADLKNTFCFLNGSRAYVSPHMGTIDTRESLDALNRAVAQLGSLLDVEPAVIACDLHPQFLTRRLADLYPSAERVAVQHHHAHVLSCAAEHGRVEPVIGVAFDGTGLGHDGAIWGGEFLVVEGAGAWRAAHLDYVAMPGGDAAAREPWRMAVAHLMAAGESEGDAWTTMAARVPVPHLQMARQMVVRAACAPPTSSVGRLFDAVAALVGLRDVVDYEGQAAMALEAIASDAGSRRYAFEIDRSREPWRVGAAPVIRAIAGDVAAGVPPGAISAAFHDALAAAVAIVVGDLARRTGVHTVALTGGVFQNARLESDTAGRLASAGLEVLCHRRVPCNDGGLSLGQALYALRQLRKNG